MNSIWKFSLDTTDEQEIAMPSGAKLLTVQVQHGVPCLWALVDQTRPTVHRVVSIHGTGHPHDAEGEYVGTYQLNGGVLVFHVFDRGESRPGGAS